MIRLATAPKPFTGKHMALLMAGFFGTVIAVNVLLADLAVSTFSGVVVENSYVASQEFNGWLGAARADKALGWQLGEARGADGKMRFTLADAGGKALDGARVTALADHPLGAPAPVRLLLREVEPGVYEAPLAPGRWHVVLEVHARGHVWHAERYAL
ncbi:MAG: FixH family protein [Novosphingobium sp.]